MLVTNISPRAIELQFTSPPTLIEPGEEAFVPDAFLEDPQFIELTLISPAIISVTGIGNTASSNTGSEDIDAALTAASRPTESNPFITQSAMDLAISEHTKLPNAHHTSKNDLTAKEREALQKADNPSGLNPTVTKSDQTQAINEAFVDHLANFDHNPSPLTTDQVDAIQASTAPSSGNPVTTVSYVVSDTTSRIAGHAADPDAHHDNSNDPTSDQKAALDANAGLTGANKVLSQLELDNHTASPTAHHSNVNDPSPSQKAAMNNASPSPSDVNPFVTSNDPRLSTSLDLTADQQAALVNAANPPTGLNPLVTQAYFGLLNTNQKAAISGAAAPSGSNVFVTSNDSRIPTNDMIQALSSASPALNSSNAVVGTNDPRLDTSFHLTADQQNALTGAVPVPTGGNPVVTQGYSLLPTADQKGAMAAASPTPTALNPYATASDPRFPTANQKAGLDNAVGGAIGSGNGVVLDSDPRMTNARTPSTHATSHITGGTDIIPNATSTETGLMRPLDLEIVTLHAANHHRADIRFLRTTTTLTPQGTPLLINDAPQLVDGLTALDVSDNLIDATGADAAAAMIANTVYALYISNINASFAPSEIRASTSAPVAYKGDRYLANTGNGANWIFVGWAATNSSIEFQNDFCVLPEYRKRDFHFSFGLGTGSFTPAVDDTYENVGSLVIPILRTDKVKYEMRSIMQAEHTSAGIAFTNNIYSSLDAALLEEVYSGIYTANLAHTTSLYHFYEDLGPVTPSIDLITLQAKFGTVLGSTITLDNSRIEIIRKI